MVLYTKSISTIVLRLLAVLSLLGRPTIGCAAGMWSVISLPQEACEVCSPRAVTVDSAGNLYVVDAVNNQIQKRDARGQWSILAAPETDPGQVSGFESLAVDTAGNLYVADLGDPFDGYGRPGLVQKRDAQGNWSVLATIALLPSNGAGPESRPNVNPVDLAVDAAGNLYVADWSGGSFRGAGQIQQRDAQGNWSVIASVGSDPGQVFRPSGLAVDTAGNLFVADAPNFGGTRIQKRDAQGNWSVIDDTGQAASPSDLAVDTAGNLYVADLGDPLDGYGRPGLVQKRDAQGNWSALATAGEAVGQVGSAPGLAVDSAGNLYVADPENHRVQVYTVTAGP